MTDGGVEVGHLGCRTIAEAESRSQGTGRDTSMPATAHGHRIRKLPARATVRAALTLLGCVLAGCGGAPTAATAPSGVPTTPSATPIETPLATADPTTFTTCAFVAEIETAVADVHSAVASSDPRAEDHAALEMGKVSDDAGVLIVASEFVQAGLQVDTQAVEGLGVSANGVRNSLAHADGDADQTASLLLADARSLGAASHC